MNAAESMLLNIAAMLQSTTASLAQKPSGAEKGDGPGFKDLLQQKSGEAEQTEAPTDTPADAATDAPAEDLAKPETLQQELAAALAMQNIAPMFLVTEEIQTPAAVLAVQTAPVVQEPDSAPIPAPVPTSVSTPAPTPAPTPVSQEADLAPPVQSEAPTDAQGEQIQVKPVDARQPDAVETQEALAPKEQAADEPVVTAKPRGADEQKVLTAQDRIDRPLFRAGDETPVKVGDAPALDAEAPEFDAQLTQKVDAALEKGDSRVEIRLTPKELGSVVVELTQKSDGALHVVLHATTEKAANLLTEHADGLGSLLRGNGEIPVRIEVQRHQESQQYQQPQDGRNRERQGQQQDQRHQPNKESDDFLQQLRLGLVSPAS